MSIIRQIDNGVEFFTVQATGESGMSLSGLERLCNIKRQSITELLNTLKPVAGKTPPKCLEAFVGKGFELQVTGYKNVVIIRDEVCTAIVEHYAFDAKKTTDEAKHFYRQFAKVGMRSWIQSVTGWQQSKPHNNGQPYWYRRLMLYRAKTKIPVGWFSIFEETISLIGDLEARGYVMPDTMIPDISIGKCWANHLRGLGYNVSAIARTYRHYYPDWAKPVDANIYSVDLLPIFKRWFEAQYKPEKMVKYFKKADARALPSVCKLLGLPEGKK